LLYHPRCCPECHGGAMLMHLLEHLHRAHHWPVELIAAWVERLE
jgi:hypothetical protein